MSQPNLVQRPISRSEELVLIYVFCVAVICLAGPLTSAVAYTIYIKHKRREETKYSYALGAASLASVPFLYLLLPLVGRLYAQFFQTLFDGDVHLSLVLEYLIPIWVLSFPLVPGVVSMGELWEKLRPKSLDEIAQAQRERLELAKQRRSEQANKDAQKGTVGQTMQLGPYIDGDEFGRVETGIWLEGDMVSFVEPVLNLGVFVLGVPNSGKTETLFRIMYEVLTKTERDVIFIDGKGEPDTVDGFRRMAVSAQNGLRGDVPVFRLGQSEKRRSAIYNGFAGNADAIYNRLVKLAGSGLMTGEGRVYGNRERNILKLICTDPVGPPRSFEDIIARLDLDYLRAVHYRNPIMRALLPRLNKESIEGVIDNLMPIVQDLYKVVGPEPGAITLGETRAACFSIKAGSVEDTATSFLRFFIEDVKDYAGNEDRQKRPALIVIDEFGEFGNDNIIKLLTRARSANIGVVLATQTVASLGDPLVRDSILENSATLFLMRTPNPSPVADHAGTVQRLESSLQHIEGEFSKAGSARLQDQYKVDLNHARKLPPGEGYLIRMGSTCLLKTAQVNSEALPPAPSEPIVERTITFQNPVSSNDVQGADDTNEEELPSHARL